MKMKRVGSINPKTIVAMVPVPELVKHTQYPDIQTVRGSVWTPDMCDKLCRDLLAGCFIPPVTLVEAAGEDGSTVYLSVDGQQRTRALAAGIAAGDEYPGLSTKTVPAIIIKDDDPDSLFSRLNSGVPVGRGLVYSLDLPNRLGDVARRLAGLPVWDDMGLTLNQRRSAYPVDIVTTAIAVAAGWDKPTTTNTDAVKWLRDNPDAADDNAVQAVCDIFGGLQAALQPYRDYVAAHRASSADTASARYLLRKLRQKNYLLALVSAVIDGVPIKDALCAMTYEDRLNDGEAIPVLDKDGKPKTIKTKDGVVPDVKRTPWPQGKTSSGSAGDFDDRRRIVRYVADRLVDADRLHGLPGYTGPSTDAQDAADKINGKDGK